MLLLALLACAETEEPASPPAPEPFDHAAAVSAVAGAPRRDLVRWVVEDAGAPHQSIAVSPGGTVAWATRDGRLRWIRDGAVIRDEPGPEGCHVLRSCPWLVVGFVDEETLAVARHGPAVEVPTVERWGAGEPSPIEDVGPWGGQPWHVALRPGQVRSRDPLLVDADGRGRRLEAPVPGRRLDAWALSGGRLAWSDWDGQVWIEGEARTLAPPEPLRARVRQIAWTPDGTRLVTVDDAGMVQVLDAATGARLQGERWPQPPDRLAVVDARRAVGISAGGVSCLDLLEGRAIATAPIDGARPRDVVLAGPVAVVPTMGRDGLVTVEIEALCASEP